MSFAVVHMQKFSKGALRGIQSHNQREKPPLSNPDVDMSKSHLNYDIINNLDINYYQEAKERIDMFCTSGKTIRKDAVLLCSFVVSSDKQFFEELPASKQEQFFEDSYKFFADRYGAEKIVNATVHLDEATPHMTVGVVPITDDGRLSAKSIFDKNELKSIQTDFVESVGKHYGLQRGVEGSTRTHLNEQQFKLKMAQEQRDALEVKAQSIISEAKSTVADNLQRMNDDIEAQKAKAVELVSTARLKAIEIQKGIKPLQDKTMRLQAQIEGYTGTLQSINEIDELGKKSMLGDKITLTSDEAQKLKGQAKAYLSEVSRNERLTGDLARLQRQVKELPDLREENAILKRDLKQSESKINTVNAIIKSKPELNESYNRAVHELQDKIMQEKQEQVKPKLRRNDLEH